MTVFYDVFIVFADKTNAYCGSFTSVYEATKFIEELDKTFRIYGDIQRIDHYEINPYFSITVEEADQ